MSTARTEQIWESLGTPRVRQLHNEPILVELSWICCDEACKLLTGGIDDVKRAYPANLCPLFGVVEFAGFGEDLGEAVNELI